MRNLLVENTKIVRHPRGGYGQYQVSGIVNGVEVKAHTTNSEAFDWFRDDSNKEKHVEAVNYVNSLLTREYEETIDTALRDE